MSNPNSIKTSSTSISGNCTSGCVWVYRCVVWPSSLATALITTIFLFLS